MKLGPHIVGGVIGGTVVATGENEILAVPVAIGAAVLPDADHLLDFYWQYIRMSRERLFLLLHGWEIWVTLFLIAIAIDQWWMSAIQIGYFTQIALDQWGNRGGSKLKYFWLYRAWHKFNRPRLYGSDSPGFYIALTHSLPWIGPKIEPWFVKREKQLYPEWKT